VKFHHFKIAAMAALILLVTACAGPGGALLKAGSSNKVFDMQLDSDMNWSRIKGPRQELWTVDGASLNSLSIFSNVKPNEHVFMLARERKSRPDGPWYRTGMRPDELRDVILDALRGQGWINLNSENLRPHKFGAYEGIRFDITHTNSDGLIYKATVAAVERNKKLTVLYWKAPQEHYYGRDAASVNKMLDAMRFVK
jgi:hypothetical protein